MVFQRLTWLHIFLFACTFLTTLAAGALLNGVLPWEEPGKLYMGLPFSLTLLLILLAHELSHYFASRVHRVSATLPYFIPAPTIVGTFGAIIKMKPPIVNKRSLIDIGAAGPVGGFVVSVIVVIIGLTLSEIKDTGEFREGITFGSSLLFSYLSDMILHADPEQHDIILHPVAFAGWVGFFITSLNLLPVGQLDGGHITYALFGEKHLIIAKIIIPLLIVLGIFYWQGWLLWAVLMIILGYRHPPVVYPDIELDRKRKVIGWICLVIFILTFTVVPIKGI